MDVGPVLELDEMVEVGGGEVLLGCVCPSETYQTVCHGRSAYDDRACIPRWEEVVSNQHSLWLVLPVVHW